MPLELSKERIRKVVDTDSGATLELNSTPEMEFFRAIYARPGFRVELTISLRQKPGASGAGEAEPPVLCITASELIFAFRDHAQLSASDIQARLKEIVQMIAFAARHHPISRNARVWTDFDEIAAGRPNMTLKGYVPTSEDFLRWSSEIAG